MKSFAAITAVGLAIASTTTAGRPSRVRRQADTCLLDTVSTPQSADVQASINQWNSDVNNVNDFLNDLSNFASATNLGLAAQQALDSAQDEPCQLSTLNNFGTQNAANTAAFTCAVSDLQSVFGTHVIANLNTIIADPSNTDAVTNAVADINIFRCCNVLPDADILWLDSAADEGLVGTVPITAGRPNACSSIDCGNTPSCKSDDNGAFGK